MSSNKLKLQAFRANDLSNDTGKQFELGKSWCDFFEIDEHVGEITFHLYFKPLNKAHENLANRQIDLQLSALTARNDRKAYANGARSGHSAIKEFFLDDLHLTAVNNSSDYFAIYKASEFSYFLYYVPKLLHDNFIKFFESISPTVTINRADERKSSPCNSPQQIFYGAPGTGKSHEIKKLTEGKVVIRTTFHPDSDYSTFVGTYKPTTKSVPIYSTYGEKAVEVKDADGNPMTEDRIVYEFVEQAFLQAYIKAWKKFAKADEGKAEEEVYLVIEEINRGNCAQIFGDLFQLLDRGEDGFSEYPIVADKDLQKQLAKAFADMPFLNAPSVCGMSAEEVAVKIRKGEILLLPNNLYIWATMNTSDQSLFPIDSAFKRRWEWKYIKIKEGRDENGNKLDWKIAVKLDDTGEQQSWWDFIKKINEIIASMTSSADKQLGYFFCCAKDGVIDEETFVSKVIFYLWNDVFKDYGFEDASLFRYTTKDEDGKDADKDLTFPDFYDEEGEKVNTERLTDFVKKVMSWKADNKKDED